MQVLYVAVHTRNTEKATLHHFKT